MERRSVALRRELVEVGFDPAFVANFRDLADLQLLSRTHGQINENSNGNATRFLCYLIESATEWYDFNYDCNSFSMLSGFTERSLAAACGRRAGIRVHADMNGVSWRVACLTISFYYLINSETSSQRIEAVRARGMFDGLVVNVNNVDAIEGTDGDQRALIRDVHRWITLRRVVLTNPSDGYKIRALTQQWNIFVVHNFNPQPVDIPDDVVQNDFIQAGEAGFIGNFNPTTRDQVLIYNTFIHMMEMMNGNDFNRDFDAEVSEQDDEFGPDFDVE